MNKGEAITCLEDLHHNLGTVSNNIDKITACSSSVTKIEDKLSSIEAAKLDVSLAFAAASLYYVLLSANGASPAESNHPVLDEISRIKEYVQKLKTVEDELKQPSVAMKIDKEAAGRFIKRNIKEGTQQTQPPLKKKQK